MHCLLLCGQIITKIIALLLPRAADTFNTQSSENFVIVTVLKGDNLSSYPEGSRGPLSWQDAMPVYTWGWTQGLSRQHWKLVSCSEKPVSHRKVRHPVSAAGLRGPGSEVCTRGVASFSPLRLALLACDCREALLLRTFASLPPSLSLWIFGKYVLSSQYQDGFLTLFMAVGNLKKYVSLNVNHKHKDIWNVLGA